MKVIGKAALVAAAAASVAVMAAGTASAVTVGGTGSAVDKTPTQAFQLCGTAYVGASTHIGGPPTGAKAVQGLQIDGALSPGSTIGSGVTGANGGYCIDGDSSMVGTVTGGGVVNLTLPNPTFTDGGKTYTCALTDTSINGGEFWNHRYPLSSLLPDRANRFNVYCS